jgi:hypothetical protein
VNTKRPTTMLVALALLVILGIGHLFVPFMQGADKIPPVVVYGDVVLGVLSLITGVGLWNLKRWGVWLTFLIAALNIISAAPGVVAAPNVELRVITTVYVLVSLLIIVLMVIPTERKALAR